MRTSDFVSKAGAVAFAVGLALAGPQALGVAAADRGDAGGSSAEAGDRRGSGGVSATRAGSVDEPRPPAVDQDAEAGLAILPAGEFPGPAEDMPESEVDSGTDVDPGTVTEPADGETESGGDESVPGSDAVVGGSAVQSSSAAEEVIQQPHSGTDSDELIVEPTFGEKASEDAGPLPGSGNDDSAAVPGREMDPLQWSPGTVSATDKAQEPGLGGSVTVVVPTPAPTPDWFAEGLTFLDPAGAQQPAWNESPTNLFPTPALVRAETRNQIISTVKVEVAQVLDRIAEWLSTLPANPFNSFLSGALLLVRRALVPDMIRSETGGPGTTALVAPQAETPLVAFAGAPGGSAPTAAQASAIAVPAPAAAARGVPHLALSAAFSAASSSRSFTAVEYDLDPSLGCDGDPICGDYPPSGYIGVFTPNPDSGIVTGRAFGNHTSLSVVNAPSKGSVSIGRTTQGLAYYPSLLTFTYTPTIAARRKAGNPGATEADKSDSFVVRLSGPWGSVQNVISVPIVPTGGGGGVTTPVQTFSSADATISRINDVLLSSEFSTLVGYGSNIAGILGLKPLSSLTDFVGAAIAGYRGDFWATAAKVVQSTGSGVMEAGAKNRNWVQYGVGAVITTYGYLAEQVSYIDYAATGTTWDYMKQPSNWGAVGQEFANATTKVVGDLGSAFLGGLGGIFGLKW